MFSFSLGVRERARGLYVWVCLCVEESQESSNDYNKYCDAHASFAIIDELI